MFLSFSTSNQLSLSDWGHATHLELPSCSPGRQGHSPYDEGVQCCGSWPCACGCGHQCHASCSLVLRITGSQQVFFKKKKNQVYLSVMMWVVMDFLLNCFWFYRPRNILVYNCTTGGINPFHWGEVGRSLVSPKPRLSEETLTNAMFKH